MIKRTVTENPLRLSTKDKNVFSKFLFALETEWQTHGFLVNSIQPNPKQEKLFLFGFPYYLMQRNFLQHLYIKLFSLTSGYLSANHRSANWFSNKNNG